MRRIFQSSPKSKKPTNDESPPSYALLEGTAPSLESNNLFTTPDKKDQIVEVEVRSLSWFVRASLEIQMSKFADDWHSISLLLEVIKDEYKGCSVYESLIMGMYWMLASNLSRYDIAQNSTGYRADFEEVLEVTIQNSLIGEGGFSHNFNTRGSRRGVQYTIKYSLNVQPSRRTPIQLEHAVTIQTPQLKSVPLFGDLLLSQGVKVKSGDKKIIFY